MDHEKPSTEDIESLVEHAAIDDWSVTDWSASMGAYDPTEVTLTIEYDPLPLVERVGTLEAATTVKEIVALLEDEHSDGALIDTVVSESAEHLDLTTDEVDDEIERLRRKGEIYEPTSGRLRTT